jgi:hypothetical protein
VRLVKRAGSLLLLAVIVGCHRAEVDLAELIDPTMAGGATVRAPVENPFAPSGLPWLGSACRSDEECGGQGLRCALASQGYMPGAGAVPRGLCTVDCASDADCRIFEPSAVCATLSEAPLVGEHESSPVPRHCLQGCSLGAPAGDTKCQGRSELACRPFAPTAATSCSTGQACPEGTFCFRGVCREAACGARCNSDADCNRDRYCHPSSGLCDTRAPQQPVLGADCDQDASACGAGSCLVVAAADGRRLKRMCTQSCTIGSLCAAGSGACIAPRLDNYIVGDAGYCQPLCECDADCRHPADHCLAWHSAALAEHFGSRGVCDVAVAGELTLTCEGGAAGANP